MSKGPPVIFLSYSREDERFARWLKKHLTLPGQARLEIRDAGEIPPGEEQTAWIEREVSAANLAVLLLSASFFHDTFIHEHQLPLVLDAAKAGRLALFPVMARQFDVPSINWLHPLQLFPPDGTTLSEKEPDSKLEATIVELAKRISERIVQITPNSAREPVDQITKYRQGLAALVGTLSIPGTHLSGPTEELFVFPKLVEVNPRRISVMTANTEEAEVPATGVAVTLDNFPTTSLAAGRARRGGGLWQDVAPLRNRSQGPSPA